VQVEPGDHATPSRAFEALTYEAPFLIEKLLKEHVVETPEEGQALFSELKRYLVMGQSDRTMNWQMYSRRIDEVWHQFILFTLEYTKFCERFFGRYVHHRPSNAPELKSKPPAGFPSFDVFRRRYEEIFGEPVPAAWYDEKSVTAQRRVLNDRAGALTLRTEDGMVDLLNAGGDVLLSVNELARDALAFVVTRGAFYVRELPGELSDEEKVELITTLVEYKVLRVGA
jgi:hypothetical protein